MTLKSPILPKINKERAFCGRCSACKVKAATDDQFVLTMAYLLTITVHILSFRQPVLTIEIIAHVREFLSTAAVLAIRCWILIKKIIKCALFQLTTSRVQTSTLSFDPTFMKVAQCAETNEKTIFRFLFLEFS